MINENFSFILLLCTSIDWTGLELLKVIESFAIIFASLVAYFGINSWKKEYSGKRKIELAEEVLTNFYQARDVISYMRSPLAFGDEGNTRAPIDGESEGEAKARTRAYVLVERYQGNTEVFNNLQVQKYRFMAVFGKQSITPFASINKISTRLLLSANRLSILWAESQQGSHSNRIAIEESYFWEDIEELDETKQQLEKLINDIENTCKDILVK